jgi:hypothetical protein
MLAQLCRPENFTAAGRVGVDFSHHLPTVVLQRRDH